MTQSTSTNYRRPFSALGHALLALFSLGYLGVTGRSCALLNICTPKLAFLVATGTVSSIFALLITALQCIELRAAALFVWSIDVALLLWWCVAVALSSLIIESIDTPLAQPILAFAWTCITLCLILTTISIASAPCTSNFFSNDNDSITSPTGGNTSQTQNNNNSKNDDSLPCERDYVPEDRYMQPASGDPNYNATNLIGRPVS